MANFTTAASPWPARCAYFSATIFTAASGLTNLTYGWQKGSDLASSIVWAGVSVGVAIIFALSWPATIKAFEAKRYSAALIAIVAMLLSGAYSITAALGSAAGGRMNAAATETATTDARKLAQAAYERAQGELDTLTAAKPGLELQGLIETTKAELAKLPAGRSVAEVEASLRAAQRDPNRYGCAFINGTLGLSCPKLDGEAARARQRERVAAKLAGLVEDAGKAEQRLAGQRTAAAATLDRASAELASIRPAKVANSDAKALARYLAAVGIDIGADRLNDLLVLLAVLVIECGGGLALALGMALTGPVPALTERKPQAVATNLPTQPSVAAGQLASSDILDCLRAAGGRIEGMRQLASRVGRPRSTVGDDCHRLAAAGRITMKRGSRGMVLALSSIESLN